MRCHTISWMFSTGTSSTTTASRTRALGIPICLPKVLIIPRWSTRLTTCRKSSITQDYEVSVWCRSSIHPDTPDHGVMPIQACWPRAMVSKRTNPLCNPLMTFAISWMFQASRDEDPLCFLYTLYRDLIPLRLVYWSDKMKKQAIVRIIDVSAA